jgi:hypothetical protein
MSITEVLEATYGITNPEHLGDGAYIGKTAEGIALFTTDGVNITRPVFLDSIGFVNVQRYVTGILR